MDFLDVIGDILAFLIFAMFFLILFFGCIPDKIWGKKDKKIADEKISELTQECRNYKKTNEELKKEIKELRQLKDSLIKKNTDLKTELRKIPSKYQRALEHCVSNYPDLAKDLPDLNEPYVNNKAVTFSQVIDSNIDMLNTIEQRISNGNAHLSQLISINNNSSKLSETIRKTFKNEYKIESFFDSITSNKLNSAINSNLLISDIAFSCKIKSVNDTYTVSLSECSCPYFRHNRASTPCKHMVYFAYSLGLLQFNQKEIEKHTSTTIEKLSELSQKKNDFEKQIKAKEKSLVSLNQKEKSYEYSFKTYEKTVDEIAKKKCDGYPQLAGMVSDYKTLFYAQSAEYLRVKKKPALTEAMRIDELRIVTKGIEKEKSILEHKLGYIYKLYPEIEQIFDDDFDYQNIPPLEQLKK